jgi:FkbM family methyltransferase
MKIKKLIYYRLRMFFLPGLLRNLGWRQTIRLLFSTGTVSLQVVGVREPVLVRTWTSDVEAFWAIFVRGEYDSIDVESAPQLVVDAGANVGYASVRFANRWPEARIVAVEPEATNSALCRRNTLPYPNIRVVEAGIWSSPGKLRIVNPSSGKWAFEVEADEDGNIPAITLAQLSEGRRIDLLKMDIEGAEREVFREPSWLAYVGVVVVETETHTPSTRDIVTAALERHKRAWTLKGTCVVAEPPSTQRQGEAGTPVEQI